MFKRTGFITALHIGMFVFMLILISNYVNAQTIYYVSSQGDDSKSGTSESSAWRTIAKVSSMNFNTGDIVSFKSGQKFSDAVLNCKRGVSYTTYGGSEKAIIGDSLGYASTDATIQINNEYVTLSNLIIYGYVKASHIIEFSKGNLTINNCEVIGGLDAHSGTIGIYQVYATPANGLNLTFTHNKIHSLVWCILLNMPYNVDVGYNEMYDLWYTKGYSDYGGGAIRMNTVLGNLSNPLDMWDAEYTFHIHHNNVHDFEYACFAVALKRVLIEYNEIHHNLDDRIYFGGCKHSDIGKIFEQGGDGLEGSVGLVFRYNYLHDLIRRGLPNYTYARPSSLPTSSPNIVSTNNGTGLAVYLGAGGPNYGENFENQPDPLIGMLGYGNFWVHDNIFFNCSKAIIGRGSNVETAFRSDLGSYFINNTIINCGNNYVTNYYGLFSTDATSNSPNTIVNNIVDFTNPNAATAGNYSEQDLYLDYNIYLHQNGVETGGWDYYPSLGSQLSAYFQTGTELSGHQHEKYLTNPDWVDISSRIFAPNIGIYGVYIPDIRIKKGGNAYNTGKSYSTIGDSYTDSYGTHQLGKDPTGRSFAYDILGNLRTHNDIGAVGSSGSAELNVILEAPFDKKSGEMKTTLNSSNLLPSNQPYNVSPWNVNDNSTISNTSINYVDWILVQLKDDLTSTKYSKAAILTKDGGVFNPDGSPFSFSNITPGQYYIVIKHRNHIGIMSSVKVQINNNEAVKYDFTDSQSKAYGTNPMTDLGNGKYGMIAGDENADGKINDLDFTAVAENIFSGGYIQGDIDMNGVVNVLDYYFINKNIARSSEPSLNIGFLPKRGINNKKSY